MGEYFEWPVNPDEWSPPAIHPTMPYNILPCYKDPHSITPRVPRGTDPSGYVHRQGDFLTEPCYIPNRACQHTDGTVGTDEQIRDNMSRDYGICLNGTKYCYRNCMMKCAMNYAEEKPRGWEDKQWGRRGKKKTSPDRDPWYVPVGDGQDYLACRKNCRCAAAKTACACEYYHGIPMDPGYTPYGVDKPNTESDFDKTCISFGCPHPNDECFCASNTLWCCSIIKDACSPYERDFLPGAKTVWSEYDEPDPWPEHDRPTTNSKMTYEEVCACTAIPHCTDACGDSGYERGSRKDIDHLYSRWWCPNDVGNWGHGNEYPAG